MKKVGVEGRCIVNISVGRFALLSPTRKMADSRLFTSREVVA